MIIEIYGLLLGLSLGVFAIGYWLRFKGLMFAGATLLLIVGAFNFLPQSVGGGVSYKTGYTQNVTDTSFYVFTDTMTYIPTDLNGWLGLILSLLAIALMFGTFFSDFEDEEG